MPHPRLRPYDPNDEPEDDPEVYWAELLPWANPICSCECSCMRQVEGRGQICSLCQALCEPLEEA